MGKQRISSIEGGGIWCGPARSVPPRSGAHARTAQRRCARAATARRQRDQGGAAQLRSRRRGHSRRGGEGGEGTAEGAANRGAVSCGNHLCLVQCNLLASNHVLHLHQHDGGEWGGPGAGTAEEPGIDSDVLGADGAA